MNSVDASNIRTIQYTSSSVRSGCGHIPILTKLRNDSVNDGQRIVIEGTGSMGTKIRRNRTKNHPNSIHVIEGVPTGRKSAAIVDFSRPNDGTWSWKGC